MARGEVVQGSTSWGLKGWDSGMSEESPYQTPQSPVVPPVMAGEAEPASIQVFAIFHFILAGIGVLFGLWSVVSMFFSNEMAGVGMPAGEQREKFVEAQQGYMEDIGWVSVMTGVFMLVLAVMLAIAGAKLWKKQKAGLVWSNRYAWTSIATKLISLVVGVLVVLPASGKMVEAMTEGMPGNSEATSMVMKYSTAAGALLGPLCSLIYPVLVLVLLNKPRVKRFLHD